MSKKHLLQFLGIITFSVILLILFMILVLKHDALIKVKKTTEVPDKTLQSTSAPFEHIRIGVLPFVGYAPYVIAKEEGFFRKEEIDVEVILFPKKWELCYSFLSGKIHFISFDAGDVGVLAALGYPVSLVIEGAWDLTSDKIIIKNKYKDLSELRGKIFACEKKAYADYFFVVKALEKYGLSTTDLQILDMRDNEAAFAFIKNKIDGIMVAEPFPPQAIEQGDGKIAVVRREIDKNPCGIWVRNDILRQYPDIVIKVLKAHFKAFDFGERNPYEYYKIANRELFNNAYGYEQFMSTKEAIYFLNPKQIKEDMKTNGPLFKYCKEIVDFYYDQEVIDTKPSPTTFIDNKLYLKALGE